MVFAIDADGVIVDLLTPWLFRYNIMYEDSLTLEQFAGKHDIHKNVKPSCGEDVYKLIETGWFFENLDPMPGAIETINNLIERKHTVLIVTSYSENGDIAHGKVNWFKRYIPKVIENKGLILCPARMKKYIKCDVFIDDYIKNVREHAKENESNGNFYITPILVDAVHNTKEKWAARMSNLAELPAYLKDIGVEL